MTRLTLVEAVEEVLAGAARMQVDLRSTLDISDEAFDALTRHEASSTPAASTVEDVVRDALDKVTDALTERQVEAVVRRVSEALSD